MNKQTDTHTCKHLSKQKTILIIYQAFDTADIAGLTPITSSFTSFPVLSKKANSVKQIEFNSNYCTE